MVMRKLARRWAQAAPFVPPPSRGKSSKHTPPSLSGRRDWYVSGRVEADPFGAALASLGVTELNLDGLPAADVLQRLRPERRELAPGQLVIDESAPRTVYPDGKHAVPERTGLAVYPSPEDVPDDWPNPIYRVGVVKGLRWVVRGGEPSRRPAVQGIWPRRTPGDRRDGAPRAGGR